MADFLLWYLTLSLFGLAALPLGWLWLRHLPDRGWGVLRPLGMMLGGATIWLGGSLGILTLNQGNGIAVLVGLFIMGLLAVSQWGGGWSVLAAWLRENRRLIIGQEILFLVAFGLWTWYRIHDLGGISHTEQPMDFALMNAVRRGGEMPPNDPWLSGFAISYYYLGFLIMALVGAISGVARGVDYNLAFASIPGLATVGAFSLVYNLLPTTEWRQRLATAALGVLLLLGISNLTGIAIYAYHNNIGPDSLYQWLAVQDLGKEPGPRLPLEQVSWWWWRASRTISDINPDGGRSEIIDEFPFFSFLLGDMHPHVMAVPYMVLGLSVALNALRGASLAPPSRWRLALLPPDAWGQSVGYGGLSLVLTAIIIGGMGILNTWDLPTQLALSALVWLMAVMIGSVPGTRLSAFIQWGAGVGLLTLLAVVLYLPFYISFDSQAAGIRLNLWSTPPQQFFLMFGLFAFVLIPLLISQLPIIGTALRTLSRRVSMLIALMFIADIAWFFTLLQIQPEERMAANLVAAGWVLLPIAIATFAQDDDPTPIALAQIGLFPLAVGIGLQRWTLAITALLVVTAAAALWARTRSLMAFASPAEAPVTSQRPVIAGGSEAVMPTLRPAFGWPAADPALLFALLLTLLACLLTMGAEMFFIRDNFAGRMNTVFKFYYQSWILFAIASAFAVTWLANRYRAFLPVLAIFFALVVGSMWYPFRALPSKADFAAPAQWDGRAWMERSDPDRFAAINWLDSLPGQVVILERPGGAYNASESALAGFTGHSTVLGWENHEGQWRGSYDEIGRRKALIEEIYTTTDALRAQQLITELDIDYVALTPLEINTYLLSGPQLDKFYTFMTPAFQQGSVTILAR